MAKIEGLRLAWFAKDVAGERASSVENLAEDEEESEEESDDKKEEEGEAAELARWETVRI